MKRIALLLAFPGVLAIHTAWSQGILIGQNTGSPDASAILDVSSDQKGLLAPRMTTAQRDAIAAPADGLLIFNTTSNCFNYRVSGFWMELCGACTPQPAPANAGPDQLELSGTTATLSANAPSSGTGEWTIISGTGGSFSGNANSANPTAQFSGEEGAAYVLRWTITTVCGTSFDDVNISFESPFCDPNPPGTLLIQTSGWCDPSPPSGWTQCAGWLNTSGDDVTNNVLNGCLNSNGRLRIKVWNASGMTLEEDVFSTNTDVSVWRTWDYLGGTVSKPVWTNWSGTTSFFTSTGGGSACYMNGNCGADAPCGTLTLGTGNGGTIILAPGATNEFEYRNNCGGQAFVNRIIAVYK